MGTLARELVTRVSGRSTREFFDEEIATPNGIDFTVGCPVAQRGRISPPFFPELPAPTAEMVQLMRSDPIRVAAMSSGFSFRRTYEPLFMDADLPAANGFASARGISQLYAALTVGLAGGAPVLSAGTCSEVAAEQAAGPDAVLPADMAFGLGFMVPMPRIPQGGPGSFGHDGAAGALGFATPRLGLSFGWISDTALSMGADPAANEIAKAIVGLLS